MALVALLVLLFAACIGTEPSHAAFSGIVKVRISPSGQSSDIRVVPHGQYYIKESSRTQLLDVEYKVHLSGSSVQLKYGSTVLYSGSKLTLVRASGNAEEDFIVFPYSPTQGTRTNYYGNIEFSVNSGLCAVNHVYIEDYLLGVVPYEMSPSWPTNALKAQAVCARNYAVKAALANPSDTWQLRDTPVSQVYRGVPGVSSTGTINYTTYNTIKNVVNGTSRKVMKYNGTVFSAYYSAWNGGETLSVPGWTGNTSSAYGYTTVKNDSYDDKRCQEAYWIKRTINTYVTPSSNDLNKGVQDMLVRKYKATSGETDVTFDSMVRRIRGQDPIDNSGDPVVDVSIVYEKFYCRAVFNVTNDGTTTPIAASITFTDTDLKQALGISYAYCAFRIVNNSNGTTTLYNVRYGHGVGMSQRGAQQMANDGKSYGDILRFYYNDITFSTLSVSAPSLPSRPCGSTPTAEAIDCDSIQLEWKAVPGATAYRIYRRMSGEDAYSIIKDGETSASYTDNGLIAGKTYYYRVRPYVINGVFRVYGARTKTVSAAPRLEAPTNFKAVSASYNSVKLTWNAVEGAEKYKIYRKTSSGSYKTVKDGLSGTGYTNGGLTSGTTYYYKVRGYKIVNSKRVYGAVSTYVTARPVPSKPTGFKAVSASYNSVRLTWDAVSGAEKYRLYRKTSSGSYEAVKDGLSGTGYSNGGLTSGTTYYYKVRGYKIVNSKRVYGAVSTYVEVSPVPSAPTNVKAVSTSHDSVRQTWDAVSGVDGYRVYRKTSSTSYEVVQDDLSETGYTDDNLTSGTTYYYKVRGYKIVDSKRVYGKVSTYVEARPVPSTPANFEAVPDSYNSVRMTWNAVEGAEGYRIYRKTSSTSYKVIKDDLSGTGYTNSGLTSGTTYYYKVCGYKMVDSERVYGKMTSYVKVKPVPFKPTGFTAVSASYNSVRLTWNAVEGAEYYKIYRKTSSGSYEKLKDGLAGTGYTNGGLTSGKTYYYKVRGYRIENAKRVYGKVTTYVTARPVPSAPTGFKAVPTSNDSVRLTWNAVLRADKYRIYRKNPSGSYEVVKDALAGTAYTDSGLTSGTTYYYKVRGYRIENSKRLYGEVSTYVTARPE